MRKTIEALHGHSSVLPSIATGRLVFLCLQPLLLASLVVLLPLVEKFIAANDVYP